jgi:hypothetical protein
MSNFDVGSDVVSPESPVRDAAIAAEAVEVGARHPVD